LESRLEVPETGLPQPKEIGQKRKCVQVMTGPN
jgi:hypothetical protein